jgi:hypothetical protein
MDQNFIRTAIDQDALNGSGPDGMVRCVADGQMLRFLVRGQSATIVAHLNEDGGVDLFTERDAGHRALAAALGLL